MTASLPLDLTILVAPVLPSKPGIYYWDAWDTEVTLSKKPRGRRLYVTPPGGVEIAVTRRTAGTFTFRRSLSCTACKRAY